MIDKRGTGVVLANYGRGVLVQSGADALHCTLKGRKQRIVCGDVVAWNWPPEADGAAVESIETRRNLFERIDARGRPEPVAANIDRLAIVIAAEPRPDWFLVDRYWAGAHLKDIATILIVNKSDLNLEALESDLEIYRAAGLTVRTAAASSGAGVAEARAALAQGVTLLVGQSGVGKSSLINALAPGAAAQTAGLTRDAEGRHTTTTARLYRLAPDWPAALPTGDLPGIVDAPGVRDFAPPASVVHAAERGFIEIHAAAPECRFKDCRHLKEPGCAVQDAVSQGRIAPRRYESYRRLMRLYEDLGS